MTIEIRFNAIEAITALSDPTRFRQTFGPVLNRGLLRIQRRMAKYPPSIPKGRWAMDTSRRQKAAFFAALRAGRISGSRTGTLGRSWSIEVRQGIREVRGVVGTNIPYAPWVHDRRRQAAFHQGRWPVIDRVMRQEEPRIRAELERAAGKLV